MNRRNAALALKLAAAINLFAMMALTVADVIGRYGFNTPLPGGFEMTEVMMGLLVFAILPIVTAADDHISIGLFDRRFRGRAQSIKKAAVSAVSAVFVGLVAWRIWVEAGRMAAYGASTAFVGIPLWPLAYFMAAMTVITFFILLGLVLAHLRAVGQREL